MSGLRVSVWEELEPIIYIYNCRKGLERCHTLTGPTLLGIGGFFVPSAFNFERHWVVQPEAHDWVVPSKD